jgi:hypothetical protein
MEYSSNCDLRWRTSVGNTGFDRANNLCIDSNGNLATSGLLQIGGSIVTQNGLVSYSSYGGNDVFLASFNPSRQLVWYNTVGGSGLEDTYQRPSITFGPYNRVWLGLYSSSTAFTQPPFINSTDFGGNTYFKNMHIGQLDGVFLGFDNTTGSNIYGSYYGGSGDDYLNTLSIKNNVGLYFGGLTTSSCQSPIRIPTIRLNTPTTAFFNNFFNGGLGYSGSGSALSGLTDAFLGTFTGTNLGTETPSCVDQASGNPIVDILVCPPCSE